jgi:hypothetical protein
MALFFRFIPIISRLDLLLLLVLLIALVPKFLYAIALRQPMLVLTDTYLIYRKVRIPWDLIQEVQELAVPTGPCVGIVLTSSIIRATPLGSSTSPVVTIGPLLQRDVAKYGAILIPPVRDMTPKELRQTILDYRALVLAKEGA